MQHFRSLTMGKPVIMGRKTYLSIGKPLAGRTTIVVSRDLTFAAPGILVAPSLGDAFTTARGDALRRAANSIVVAGGAEIYAQAMPQATHLAITWVHKRVEGRCTLPGRSILRFGAKPPARSTRPQAEDEAAFAFVQATNGQI